MRLSRIEMTGFKKHTSATFDFPPGSSLIVGPNYSGKSSIMQAVLVGILGSYGTSVPLKLLVSDNSKDFSLRLTFEREGGQPNLVVQRTSKDSSITREGEGSPYAVGHTAVNKEMVSLLQQSRQTFLKVFTSEQGTPQQLLQMEGAELQKFIENVSGLSALEAIQKGARAVVTEVSTTLNVLAPFLLGPGEKEEAQQQLIALSNGIEQNKAMLAREESNLATAKAAFAGADTAVADAHDHNVKANQWIAAKENYSNQLSLFPEQELVDLELQETELNLHQGWLSDAQSRLFAAKDMNNKVQAYTAALQQVEQDIAALGEVVEVQDITVEAYRSAKEGSFKAWQETLNRLLEGKTLEARGSIAKASKGKIEQVLAALPPPMVFLDSTENTLKLESLKASLMELRRQYTETEHLLSSSVCPTCKRPWEEGQFDVEETKAKLADLLAKINSTVLEVSGLKEALDAALAHNNAATLLARERESLQGQLDLALSDCEEVSRAMDEFTASCECSLDGLDTQVKNLEATYKEASATLDKWIALHAEAKGKVERLAGLKLRKDSLVDPCGVLEDLQPLEKGCSDLAAGLKQMESKLTEARTLRAKAMDNNSRRQVILDKLKGYPEADRLALIDLAPLQEQRAMWITKTSNLQDSLRQYTESISKGQLAMQPLQIKLEQHKATEGKMEEANKKANIYKFIEDLVANSRVKFLDQAFSTMFQVASEFAKLSTNGDMQEVLIHEGLICYKEGGKIRPKACASGAQKSIMGLGMKLGVCNLIVSDFDTLLLDEVSADMSDEISLNCMQALSVLVPNSIVITHRAMDTAGHVIQL